MKKIEINHITTDWHNNTRVVFMTSDCHGLVEIQYPKDEPELGYIWHLWVDEGFRRRGYATALMDAAEEHIRLQGKTKAALEWDWRDTPVRVYNWYKSRGYEDTKVVGEINELVKQLDEEPIEYKFKIGDKVRHPRYKICEIAKYIKKNNEPWYHLKCIGDVKESELEPYPQNITERIKTLADACDWCCVNNHGHLVYQHEKIEGLLMGGKGVCESDDILAYLKLRIITAALNEGWEPEKEFDGDWVAYDETEEAFYARRHPARPVSQKLFFRDREVALYAAEQFRDIYFDYFGLQKGGER